MNYFDFLRITISFTFFYHARIQYFNKCVDNYCLFDFALFDKSINLADSFQE